MFNENTKETKTSGNQYLGIAFFISLITCNDITFVRYTIREETND